jgi:5-methylcytosine-specific restriction endonuclease McrA
VNTDRVRTKYGLFCEPCATARKHARESRKNYRRRTATRLSDLTVADMRLLRQRTKRCPMCYVQLSDLPNRPDSKHLDHIIPVVIGGTHTVGNVRIICRTCNLSRPKDGSDLDGHQPTLWAQDMTLAEAVDVRLARRRCGTCNDQLRQGRCWSCRPHQQPQAPLRALGPIAAQMREAGMKWQEISDELQLKGPGNAHRVAHEYGNLGRDPGMGAKSA